MLVVKQFMVRKCGHEKLPIAASECLYSLLENNNQEHFIIATQDKELSGKVRDIPGIPQLYIKYNAVILEKPSAINMDRAQEKRKEIVENTEFQNSVLKKLKIEMFGEDIQPKRKNKKLKGPNPLSCKKKKPKKVSNVVKAGKRKRHNRTKSLSIP